MFCWVMSDLDACIRSSWHYHQLRIAGLMRLLVIDERPLVHQVNRTHRLIFLFLHGPRLHAFSADAGEDLEYGGVLFSTASLLPARIQEQSQLAPPSDLTSWLSLPAARAGGIEWSVREFVQQMAYVEGLTHAGTAKTVAEKDLLTARKNLFRRDDNLSEPHLDLLKQIGRITHTGLIPLLHLAQKTRLAQGWTYPTFDYEVAAT
jgi:hypothetical protein